MLIVSTGPLSQQKRFGDALNITRMSAGPKGLVFAPSAALLASVITARRRVEHIERLMGVDQAIELDLIEARGRLRAARERYVHVFDEEMEESRSRHKRIWNEVLAMSSITLLCYCDDPAHCHRTYLARDILPRHGARYYGPERGVSNAARRIG